MPDQIVVTLTDPEWAQAAAIGCERHINNMRAARKGGYGYRGRWGQPIEKACGERALAKHLGVYWNGTRAAFPVVESAGVGSVTLEARSAEHQDAHLFVSEQDSPDSAYVLLTGRSPVFVIRGWYLGADALCLPRDIYFRALDPKAAPSFVIPQSELRSITELAFRRFTDVAAA